MKKTWLIPLFIFGIAIVLIPIIINFAYMRGYELKIVPNIFFSASDWLTYFGAFLTFAGTISLGITSLLQNERLHKRNVQLEEDNKRIQLLMAHDAIPVICIERFTVAPGFSEENISKIQKFSHVSSQVGDNGFKTYRINLYNHNSSDTNCFSVNGMFFFRNISKVMIGSIELVSIKLDRRLPNDEGKIIIDSIKDVKLLENNKLNFLLLPEENIPFTFTIYCDSDFLEITQSPRIAMILEVRIKLLTGLSFIETIDIQHMFNITRPIEYSIKQEEPKQI